MDTPWTVKATPYSASSVAQLNSVTQTRFYGYTLRETSGSATATVRFRDTNNSGTILETVQLSAGESRSEFWPMALGTGGGVYMSTVSGAVEGSVRVG